MPTKKKSGVQNEKDTRNLIRNLRKDLLDKGKKITLNILKEEADRFLADLKQAIESQSLKLKPLKPRYKAWKIQHGLDPRILIATGKLLAAYQVEKLPKGHGEGYVVNVARRKQNGVWLSTIDRAHEYGVPPHLPKRPHWRPVMAKFKIRKQEVGLRISQELAKTVRVRATR